MNPMVVGVMLANGRPEMVNRAVKSFLAQRYEYRSLLIFDTSYQPLPVMDSQDNHLVVQLHEPANGRGIGPLRNAANAFAVNAMGAKILAHFDSDDWSAPNRIQDQVDLLDATGADAVGYHEMVFWKSIWTRADEKETVGEAWLFSSPHHKNLLGTSLCYLADTWLARPFPPQDKAEDHLWLLKVKKISGASAGIHAPMMIASVHGANTCSEIKPGCAEWTRLSGADSRIGQVMAL